MNRYSYSGARGTVESSKRVELTWLKSKGYFPKEAALVSGSIQWSINGDPTGDILVYVNTDENVQSLRMIYKIRPHGATDEGWKDYDYSFPLERIPCHFGGYKWFVRCQLYKGGVFCGRRVRVLYSVGNYFGCRFCAELSYNSCNETKRFRGWPFRAILDEDKAYKLYASLRRFYYRGKPTKNYRKYLRIVGSEEGII